MHSAPGDYLFTHLLTRDAAYRALLERSRASLHSAAADALADGLNAGAPDELVQLGQLQLHLEGARRWHEAHAYCCRALSSKAMQGYTRGWEAQAARAGELWELARAADPALPPQSAGELNAWAFYLTLTGRIAEAHEHAAAAYALSRVTGDQQQQGAALRNHGIACQYSGEIERALDFYRQSLELANGMGDKQGILRGLNNVGLGLLRLGELERGLDYLQRGRELARELGDRVLLANLELNYGVACSSLGRSDAATEHTRSALELARSVGDLQTEAAALANIGDVHIQQGDAQGAEACIRQSLAIARQIDMPTLVGWCLCALAELALGRGMHAEAATITEQALATARSSRDHEREVAACFIAALVAQAGGDSPGAAAAYQLALDTAEKQGLLSLPAFQTRSKEVAGLLGLP